MTEEKDNTILRRQTGTTIPSKRRKKKKFRKLPFVILIIVVLLIVMITYVVHGYQRGMKYAQEHAKDIKIHKFNGAVKNDGKITVLMLGADQANGGKSRTDSIMVVQYDYIKKKMKMMSIMQKKRKCMSLFSRTSPLVWCENNQPMIWGIVYIPERESRQAHYSSRNRDHWKPTFYHPFTANIPPIQIQTLISLKA